MKKFIFATLTIAAVSIAQSAKAATVTCVDAGIANSGYTVSISDARDAAKIVHATGVTSAISCAHVGDVLSTTPGEVVLKCHDTTQADNGFVLSVKANDCSGGIAATLETVSFAGAKLVANMRCTHDADPVPPTDGK